MDMSRLGPGHEKESIHARVEYEVNLLANNIAGKSFELRIPTRRIWRSDGFMLVSAMRELIRRVGKRNALLRVERLDPVRDRAAIPYLLEGPTEYLAIFDLEHRPIIHYLVAIQPNQMFELK